MKDLTPEEYEKLNAQTLLDFALIFASNNSKKFLNSFENTFEERHVDNLRNNYIEKRELKYKRNWRFVEIEKHEEMLQKKKMEKKNERD